MAVAWNDFLLIAAVVKELRDAMKSITPEPQRSKLAQTTINILRYFKIIKQKHDVVRKAAQKYRKCFQNPAVAELMEGARTELKFKKI